MPYYFATADANKIFNGSFDKTWREWLVGRLQATRSDIRLLLGSGLVPGGIDKGNIKNVDGGVPGDSVVLPEGIAVVVAWTDRTSALMLQRDLARWLHAFHSELDERAFPKPHTSALDRFYRAAPNTERIDQVMRFTSHQNDPRIDLAFTHINVNVNLTDPNSANSSATQMADLEVWAVGARPVLKRPWTSKRAEINDRTVQFYELFTSVAGEDEDW